MKNEKLSEWAAQSDEEFFERYFEDATEEEIAEFLKEFPEFLENEEQ